MSVERKKGKPADPVRKKVLIREGIFHLPESPREQPYLIGSKCSNCGYVSFPSRVVCPDCLRDDTMEKLPLSRRGRIHSFTLTHVAPPGITAPYLQGEVDLPEGPRVFSLISGCPQSEDCLRIGMEMELIIDKIRDDEQGNEVIGYKFRPLG